MKRALVGALLTAAALTGCHEVPQDDTRAVVDTIINVAEAGQEYGATLDLDLSSYRDGVYTFHHPDGAADWQAMRVAQRVAKADPHMKFVLVGDYSVVAQYSFGGEYIRSLCVIGPTIASPQGECEEVN